MSQQLDINLTEMKTRLVTRILEALQPLLEEIEQINTLERFMRSQVPQIAENSHSSSSGSSPAVSHPYKTTREAAKETIRDFLKHFAPATTSELMDCINTHRLASHIREGGVRQFVTSLVKEMPDVRIIKGKGGPGAEYSYELTSGESHSGESRSRASNDLRESAGDGPAVNVSESITNFIIDTLVKSNGPISTRQLAAMYKESGLPQPTNDLVSNMVNAKLRQMKEKGLVNRSDSEGAIFYSVRKPFVKVTKKGA